MVSLQYKGRIYKSKLSLRSIRYILSDQVARAVPALQQRWLFPVEERPIGDAAAEDLAIPSPRILTPVPDCLTKLGVTLPQPLQVVEHFYRLRDTVVTGWAGAMMKDGFLLALHPSPNWTAQVRARRHKLRTLPATRPYYNLMAPIPARGHIVHWLFEAVVPLLTYLESGGSGMGLGLIVNAERSGIQQTTLDYFKERYGIDAIEQLGAGDAALVPDLRASDFRARNAAGPAPGLGAGDARGSRPVYRQGCARQLAKRIYISRNDAQLRRVSNEDRLLPILAERGFERVVLKGLPMARQVQYFRQAEAVIGPHGAGLAHTAWCKPGTKVVEFFPGLGGPRGKPKNAGTGMWLIATQRGHDYRGYLAGPPETRDDAFAIPGDVLLGALDAASIR